MNDQADIKRDKADIRSDRKDIQADRRDIAKDRADIRADRQDVRTDHQDLRANQGDLRNDRGNVRSSDLDDQRTGGQDPRSARNIGQPVTGQRMDGGQRMEGTKPGISAATVANNAAENNKKAQATENVHKAWYHVWW